MKYGFNGFCGRMHKNIEFHINKEKMKKFPHYLTRSSSQIDGNEMISFHYVRREQKKPPKRDRL
jgi:hypothetical protein